MNEAVTGLRRQLAAVKTDMETLHKDSGSSPLTADQQAKWGQLLEQKNGIEAALQREIDIREADKALAAITPAEKEVLEDAKTETPKESPKLFANFGEQIQSVAKALESIKEGDFGAVDQRLLKINAAASGSATMPLQDGGFLIQTQFSDQIWKLTNEIGQLASRCMSLTLGDGFNAIEIPILKDYNRTDGNRFGGVTVYRSAEAASVDYTKIKFEKVRMESSKLQAMCAFTHELLRDASAVESITTQAISEEFAVVLDEEIHDGDGGQGRCKGIMNAGGLITVNKETNQAAATLVPQNIAKMYARVHPRFRSGAVWLANVDIDPQLQLMTLPIGTAGIPVFLPPNGLVSAPNGMLYGKPIVYVETAETLGTTGDLLLVDLSQYVLVRKEGLRVARSEHVLFTSDQIAIRFTMEVNGQPKYNEAITPKKGSNTLSPFVALQTRS